MMKNNRILALLLALVMGSIIVMPAFAAETEKNNEAAEATEAAPPEEILETIYVEDADDLLELAEKCRLDTWSRGKLVILRADISLDQEDFLPIPSFGGIFDGGGHTISGLHITENVTPAGLFGQLRATGIIKNLTVSGTVVPGGDGRFVGGIVGENYGTITDCTFTGNIAGSGNTGGIAGINALTGKISGCEVSGTILGSDMTGGIAGCNLGVIGSCVNKAYINTASVDPSLAPEDLTFDFLTDVSKLTSLDTSTAAMDTGGIAGYSSGIIESCTNQAAIGYPHIGYNVGGIAGRSCGYIHDCENTADIYGRKDVGGIAGQMEPYIARNLTESAMAKLQRQLDELNILLDAAMEHADSASDTITKRLNGIAGAVSSAGAATQDIRTTGTISSSVTGSGESSGEGGVTVTPAAGEAGGSVQVGDGSIEVEIGGSVSGGVEGSGNSSANGSVDAETQINISTNMAGLSSSLYGMAGQMRLLSGELAGASDELMADVELIQAKINEITDTGFGLILGDGEENVIIDSSGIDIDLITLGKVSFCTNSGKLGGDINVGGIAGCVGMEYALDPEDDVTVGIDGSTKRQYEVKAVVQHCENAGTVTAKRNYAGGITGKMDLGLIAGCESYGPVSSESGNYVGGIAGIGGSTIRHSFSKCTLSGGKYIGGIVGSGVEEDRNGDCSIVAGCYAIVTITEHKQYAGAISGADAGTFLENYFVSEELAGINRMSCAGCAEPITYAQLMEHFESQLLQRESLQTPGEILPDEFQHFTLKFIVDGQVVCSEIFEYGASFDAEAFPEIPNKPGYYGYWDRTELTELKYDTTVTAVYEPYITALESEDVRNGTRPIIFVQGEFAKGDTLSAKTMPLTCKNIERGDRVLEQWELAIPDDGAAGHTIRYLPPNESTGRISILVLEDDVWTVADVTVIGSYVTFRAEGDEIRFAVVSEAQTWWIWLAAGAAGLLVILLLLWLTRKYGERLRSSIRWRPAGRPIPGSARWKTVLLVILALLVGIGGTAGFFLLRDFGVNELTQDDGEKESPSMGAISDDIRRFTAGWQDLMNTDPLSAELILSADCGPLILNEDLQFCRWKEDEHDIFSVQKNGYALYFSEDTICDSNGNSIPAAGAANIEAAQLLNIAYTACKNVSADCTVEGSQYTYTLSLDEDGMKEVAYAIAPEAKGLDISFESGSIRVIITGERIESVAVTVSGSVQIVLSSADVSIGAKLNFHKDSADATLPDVVKDVLRKE